MRRRARRADTGPLLLTIPFRRRRRWPIAAAVVLVLGLVGSVAVVWGGRDDGPGRLVAEAAEAVGGWRGVSYDGGTTDPDGIETGVRLTVTDDGIAHGTLTREFGGEAEIAVDADGTVFRGNTAWWLTDEPGRAEALDGLWVADPPAVVTGLRSGMPLGPAALAAELARPGAQPWAEIGRETVGDRDGLVLSDGARRVVVSVDEPRTLLSVGLPARDVPQVVPRAFVAQQPTPPAPPDDEAEQDDGPPPQYVENFTIAEPDGRVREKVLNAVTAIRVANKKPAGPRRLEDVLRSSFPGEDQATVTLVHQLAARGVDAEKALDAGLLSPHVLGVLAVLTADLDPGAEKPAGPEKDTPAQKITNATGNLRQAVQARQFAALYEVATNGNLLNPEALRDFTKDIKKPDTQRHLQAVARLTEAGNQVRIELEYVSPLGDGQIDWVVVHPARTDVVPSNVEYKRVTSEKTVADRIREAAFQLEKFRNSQVFAELEEERKEGGATARSENLIVLHFENDMRLGRMDRAELQKELAQLDAYGRCASGGGGTCRVDRIIVDTVRLSGGKPVIVSHEFEPEDLKRPPPGAAGPGGAPTPDPDPGPAPAQPGPAPAQPGPAPAQNDPAPDPAPDSGPTAPDPAQTGMFAGPDGTVAARGVPLAVAAQSVPPPAGTDTPAGTNTPGGIDFSTLELRYLAEQDTDDGRSMRYAFAADPVTGAPVVDPGPDAPQQASDAFFVWLALPRSAFTVNLNPEEPDRIVDAGLGRTDAGRILLEADLQLKKTTAGLIHPDTELGARYWDAISWLGDQTCQSFRQWIVPAPAEVWDNGDELYILDAPLQVKMESEYLASAETVGAGGGSCPEQLPAIEEQNEDTFRTMILPEVERAVNEAPEYADLRQVYLSRVAAEWYRQRSLTESLSFSHLIDTDDVAAWPARQQWSPREVFDRYVRSFTEGEFNVTRETYTGAWIETWTYVYGGVDWTEVTFAEPGPQPDLATTVSAAAAGPTAGGDGRIWLSSASALPDPGDPNGPGLGQILVVAVITAGVAVGVRSWRRVRRADRAWATGVLPPR